MGRLPTERHLLHHYHLHLIRENLSFEPERSVSCYSLVPLTTGHMHLDISTYDLSKYLDLDWGIHQTEYLFCLLEVFFVVSKFQLSLCAAYLQLFNSFFLFLIDVFLTPI